MNAGDRAHQTFKTTHSMEKTDRVGNPKNGLTYYKKKASVSDPC